MYIAFILTAFSMQTSRAGVCLLQSVRHDGHERSATVTTETSTDVISEEEAESDGDYLEVDIRRHHGQPRRRVGAMSGHSLVVPFSAGHRRHENSSGVEPSQTVAEHAEEEIRGKQVATAASHPYTPITQHLAVDESRGEQGAPLAGHPYTHIPEHLSTEQLAAAQQFIATSGASLVHPSARMPGMTRGLELMIGIMLGVLLSLLALTTMGYWSKRPVSTMLPAQAPLSNPGLSGGRLDLVQFHYHGAKFMQFSWAFDGSSGTHDHDPVSILSDNREVGRVLGRLMATPNGEMYLMSSGSTWAILKRPLPNRRPGQLWDFKVCRADGTPYAEVRQRSETKCHIDDAVTQRRIMTVIGNFTYPVFLSGERSIHVWITQGSSKPSLCAQCEARPEMETEGLPPSSQSRRFHVTTTSNIDASLVLAILLGLQDVHSAARRANVAAPSSSSEQSARGDTRGTVALGGGTGAASNPGATSSGNNGGQSSASGAAPVSVEERVSEKPPMNATEPAMAA